MRERFVLRDEVFGGTLFDRDQLRHRFIKSVSLQTELPETYEYWSLDTTVLPREIIYSPIRVYFEVTKACNLRCQHCFNSSGKIAGYEMSTEEMMTALDGMRGDAILDIRFTGGEPTSRPDWYLIFSKAKTLGFGVLVNTNGVYEDPAILEMLTSLDLEQVTISIDGTRKNHDSVRGLGSYDKAMENLKALAKMGARLRTNTVLTERSLQDMESTVQSVAPYVSEMNFFFMRPTGRARKFVDNSISFDELAEFNKQAEKIVKRYPDIHIMFGSQAMRASSISLNDLQLQIGGPDGFTRLNLSADGSIWPGGYSPYIDKSLILGNIKDEGFTTLKIWRNSEKLRKFRNLSQALVERCLSCVELDGRCRGINVEMELLKQRFPKLGNPYCVFDKELLG